MVSNEDAKVVCALFYDRDDGVVFGRLICSTILNAFTQEYSAEFTQMAKNRKDFYGFQKKISSIIRLSPRSILQKLEALPMVKRSVLVNDREVIHTPRYDVDQLAILANLNAFVELCTGIMNSVNDSAQHVEINTSCGHTLLLWRVVDKTLLVLIAEQKAARTAFIPQVAEALELIEQVCLLHASLEQMTR
eukprot:CAMPEP_0174955304 /NCGR_PEP_ID=MMETSP0004_2-20121128/909_1 /TAXON_ID=420556 /ORGANISM="Ochromonas sp., Strain CCMP1393" /LENGTH=190 /DNA_ID=CAMNT_0016203221 /DNA_START=110 /DNA_END=682 /DNA_ORIENTATION=+